MKKSLLFFVALFISQSFYYYGKACTTFCIKDTDNLVFGRNFDFDIGFGQIVINKRSVKKTAMIQPPEKPIEWISKYGSITFNQGGREFPYGGINETGLVIELMWLGEAKYPEIDNRYGLSELQWIQYQLDNSKTVADVLNSDTLIRISSLSLAPLHFLVCDKEGQAATIEYINGQMVVHTGSELPVAVLTNHSYKISMDYLATKADFWGQDAASFTSGSLDRFANAASMIKKYDGGNCIDYSFDILHSVRQEENTQWSIVYDIRNMAVYYKTRNNDSRRSIKVEDFDFACSSPSLIVDIEDDMDNDKVVFKDYTYQANRALLDSVSNNVTIGPPMTEVAIEYAARYPETTICIAQVAGVHITPENVTMKTGESKVLEATVLPEDATDALLTWLSGDTSIATVDSNGMVTAVAKGTVIITVATLDGGSSATCTVFVNDDASNIETKKKTEPFIQISPNPVSENEGAQIYLYNVKHKGTFNISVFNITGKKVCSTKGYLLNTDIQSVKFNRTLNRGAYIVIIQSDKIMMKSKLIVK